MAQNNHQFVNARPRPGISPEAFEAFCVIAYFAFALLTFGYVEVFRCDEWRNERLRAGARPHVAKTEAEIREVTAIVAWPAYWAGKGSIELFEAIKARHER